MLMTTHLVGFGAATLDWSPADLGSLLYHWYDPSDLSTLFQDIAGTTPVTEVGQTVGKMLNKKAGGPAFTTAADANRPTLQVDGNGKYYCLFDKSDDHLVTTGASFPTTSLVSLGMQKASGNIVTLTKSYIAGTGFCGAGVDGNATSSFNSSGTVVTNVNGGATNLSTRDLYFDNVTSGQPNVVSFKDMDLSAWTGGLCVGHYTSFVNFERLYGLVLINNSASAEQKTSLLNWMAGKSGVTL